MFLLPGNRWTRAILFYLGLALAASASADDFRIETRLFTGDAVEPASNNVTLFQGGLVYDYLWQQGECVEISVLDAEHGRFYLLQPATRQQTAVDTAHLLLLLERLKAKAANHRDTFARFQAQPKFDERADQVAGQLQLTFESPWLSYRVQAADARSPEAARQYGDFSDWYARLNVMSHPASLPFARLRVNEALRERQAVPDEVRLSVAEDGKLPDASGATRLRTEHRIDWRLMPADEQLIEQTRRDLQEFRAVPYQAYRQGASPAAP